MKKINQIILLLIIGAGMLVIAFLIRDTSIVTVRSFVYEALINCAFIVLTLFLVNIIWGLLGGEPIENLIKELQESVRLIESSKKSGLVDLYPTSGAYGSHEVWMKKLRSAEHNVDLQGYTLHVWTRGENFSEEILQLIKRGVNIRILIMDEENEHFNAIINTKQITSLRTETVKDEIKAVKDVFEQISREVVGKGYPGTLKLVKVKKGVILSQICRIDSTITIIPYMYSCNTSETPLMEAEGGDKKLYKKYVKEFNSLWELNEQL